MASGCRVRNIGAKDECRILRADDQAVGVEPVAGSSKFGVDFHADIRTILRLGLKDMHGLKAWNQELAARYSCECGKLTLRSDTEVDVTVRLNISIGLLALAGQNAHEQLGLHVVPRPGLSENREDVDANRLLRVRVHDSRLLNSISGRKDER